ncbi:coenzyme F420 hydrogenase subunit beta [Sphingomonas zeicaulis]|uniref:Coenzyme F420 hydrogenase/dehydrogenase, beta subunit C-terminal domain n=1 Tax=Sphingomonas zeicaulis TaxID=1632740 RepID=UPI003D24DA03
MMARRVDQIRDAGLCSGCGLCAGVSGGLIEMGETADGYQRPRAVAPLPAAVAELVDTVCPGLNIDRGNAVRDADYHPVWGPIIETKLGWSTDNELRRNASSGGGLSGVLVHLIETGQIDYVVQTAMSEESPVRNALKISTGRDDIFQSAGSRYAPSSPLADIAARLDAPGRFAFVGKPCDVAGLRNLARVDPRVNEKVPYMLAFMCAGVPSYKGTDAVLKAMGVPQGAEVTSFRFRGDGWPGYATAVLADGSRYQMDYNTSWGTILNRFLQFRCKVCPDGTGEFADITFADGWHCDEKGYPLFEETDGRSLVITRTRRGAALFDEAEAAGRVASEPVPVRSIHHMQPFQAKRKGLVLSRLAALGSVGHRPPRFRGLSLPRNARTLGAAQNAKSYLGTLRRLMKRRKPA